MPKTWKRDEDAGDDEESVKDNGRRWKGAQGQGCLATVAVTTKIHRTMDSPEEVQKHSDRPTDRRTD